MVDELQIVCPRQPARDLQRSTQVLEFVIVVALELAFTLEPPSELLCVPRGTDSLEGPLEHRDALQAAGLDANSNRSLDRLRQGPIGVEGTGQLAAQLEGAL
mgnify:CR=1 FL=1